jgi:acetyl-CoA carboxylase carboxyltransferase component
MLYCEVVITFEEARRELDRRRRLAAGSDRLDRIRRQRQRGLLTGLERVNLLCDPGTFVPMGRMVHSEEPGQADRTLGGDGALHGFGSVDGRLVAVHATDPTVKGATAGPATLRVGRQHERLAELGGLAYFDLQQGGGARITDFMSSRFAGSGGGGFGVLHARPRRFAFLSAILGDYFPPWNLVQADFSVMTSIARGALTSPLLMQMATGERVSADEIGGVDVHRRITGYVDAAVHDEHEAIATLRRAFGYLPSTPFDVAPRIGIGDPADRSCPDLAEILPTNERQTYDVRDIIGRVVDRGSFLELAPDFAPNLVAGFGRLDGHSVLILATQPKTLAGSLDVKALIKARKYLGLSDTFSLPVVSFLDTPGALPTKEQEFGRIVNEVYQSAASRLRKKVPKVSVVMRKGVGFAYFALGGSDMEGLTFAWPSSRIAFTGAEPAARIVYRQDIDAAPDPMERMNEHAEAMREQAAPWHGARLAYLDAVIEPAETRAAVIRGLRALGMGRCTQNDGVRSG